MESVWQLLFIGYHYRASTIYYFSSPYLAEETVVEAYHLICELGLRLAQLAMYHSDTGCRMSPYVYPNKYIHTRDIQTPRTAHA